MRAIAEALVFRRDEHRFALRRGDDSFVHKDVFLKGTFEIVAKGAGGLSGGEPAVIGFDEETLARFEFGYAFTYGFNADAGFVTRDGRFIRRDVTADFLKMAGVIPDVISAFRG